MYLCLVVAVVVISSKVQVDQAVTMDNRRVDVIVVGAGISGLSAAKLLKESGQSVVVLEARDRVGGRTYTKRDPSYKYVDIGGAYVGPSQNRILRMADELGIQTFKVNNKGDYVHFTNGSGVRFQGSWPRFWNPLAWCDVNNVFYEFDKLIEKVPIDAPWETPNAEALDKLTVQQWVDQVCWTNAAKEFFVAFTSANVTMEMHEISLLWYMWYVKSCGGTKRIWEVENGGQERKFVGGSGQISEKIAERLGDAVVLNSPVLQVCDKNGKVTVTTLDGQKYEAGSVILALSPTLLPKIRFDPPLPPMKSQLTQRLPMGSCIKNNVFYEKPFWREKGLNGFTSCDGTEVVCNTVDDCKPDGTVPAITGFICGDQARKLATMSAEERKQATIEYYGKLFGSKKALKPVGYEEGFWMNEEYSGGCYTSTYPTGVMSRYGKYIRNPIGNLYFAGTETATEWTGYMDGAVEAGERAARETLFARGLIRRDQIWQREPENKNCPVKPFEDTFAEKMAPSVNTVLRTVGAGAVLAGLGAAWAIKSKL